MMRYVGLIMKGGGVGEDKFKDQPRLINKRTYAICQNFIRWHHYLFSKKEILNSTLEAKVFASLLLPLPPQLRLCLLLLLPSFL